MAARAVTLRQQSPYPEHIELSPEEDWPPATDTSATAWRQPLTADAFVLDSEDPWLEGFELHQLP